MAFDWIIGSCRSATGLDEVLAACFEMQPLGRRPCSGSWPDEISGREFVGAGSGLIETNSCGRVMMCTKTLWTLTARQPEHGDRDAVEVRIRPTVLGNEDHRRTERLAEPFHTSSMMPVESVVAERGGRPVEQEQRRFR